MEFMLLLVDRKDSPPADPTATAELGRFTEDLRQQGKLKATVLLRPAPTGARVEVREGKAVVTDGSFAGGTESVAGSLVVEVASRAEAIEIAKRCPHARAGTVEVRLVPDRDVARVAAPTTFMFLLHMDPDLEDADGAKYREMVAYDETLKREGKYVESSQLALDPPAARVE
ncbi:MAG: YciI family protein, partial [Candidatus Binatia bacterium]